MSKNDSYRGGSTTFHKGSNWFAKNKTVDAEKVFQKEREAEAAKRATEEWFSETDPNQDPSLQRQKIGARSRKFLKNKQNKDVERKRASDGNQLSTSKLSLTQDTN